MKEVTGNKLQELQHDLEMIHDRIKDMKRSINKYISFIEYDLEGLKADLEKESD